MADFVQALDPSKLVVVGTVRLYRADAPVCVLKVLRPLPRPCLS